MSMSEEKVTRKSGGPQSLATAGSANSTIASGNAPPSVGGSSDGHTMAAKRVTTSTKRELVDQGRITGTMRGNFTTQGDDPNVPDSSNSPLWRGKKSVATGEVDVPGD